MKIWLVFLWLAAAAACGRDSNTRTGIAPSPSGALEIEFQGTPMAPYQLRTSPDLAAWSVVLDDEADEPSRRWTLAPPADGAAFYEVIPRAAAFDPGSLAAAADYSRTMGGAAVLVLQNGQVIFEDYHNGATPDTATHVASGTKGFFACALAAAIEDGLISGPDEIVADTLTEWQDSELHPGKDQITVGMLASLSSGLSQDTDYIQGLDPLADDIYAYVVDSLRLVSTPGDSFQYGPSHYYVFGVLLSRKLAAAGRDQNPLDYLEERILRPIGVEYTHWEHDDAGNPHIPNGATLTPRNWLKFGRFLLQRGSWEGRAIVDSALMADLLTAAGPNPGHGRFLWLNQPGGHSVVRWDTAPPGSPGGFIYHHGHPEIFAAMGAGKNRLYIVPRRNAVILRQTQGDTGEFIDTEFLHLLLGEP